MAKTAKNSKKGSTSTGSKKSKRGSKSSRANDTSVNSESLEASSSNEETSFIGNLQPSLEGATESVRGVISRNANLQTAGIVLAGAGLLSLFGTKAGRSLLRSGAEAVISLVDSARSSWSETVGTTDSDTTEETAIPQNLYGSNKNSSSKSKSQI